MERAVGALGPAPAATAEGPAPGGGGGGGGKGPGASAAYKCELLSSFPSSDLRKSS